MATSARLDELKKKFDESPRRYFAPLANEFRKLGDLTQAVAICRAHLPNQPGHVSGHIVLAQALYEARELAESRVAFEGALDLDPENLIALRYLGDIAREDGAHDVARSWYERVLDADPRNDEIATLLAALPLAANGYAAPAAEAAPAEGAPDLTPVAWNPSSDDAGEPQEGLDSFAAHPAETADQPPSAPTLSLSDADEELDGDFVLLNSVADTAAPPESGVTASSALSFDLVEDTAADSAPSPAADAVLPDPFADAFDVADEAAPSREPAISLGDLEAIAEPSDDWFQHPAEVVPAATPEDTADDFFPDLKSVTPTASPAVAFPSLELDGFGAPADALVESATAVDFDAQHDPHLQPELEALVEAVVEPLVDPVLEPVVEPVVEVDFVASPPVESAFAEHAERGEEPVVEVASEAPAPPSLSFNPWAVTPSLDPAPAVTPEAWAFPGESVDAAAGGDETAMSDLPDAGDGQEELIGEETEQAGVRSEWDEEGEAAAPLVDAPYARTPEWVTPVSEPAAGAFVTETMAELYLKQGFAAEALAIYRQLLAQSPGDQSLRDRIEALDRAGEAESPASDPPVAPKVDPLGQSARSFFAHFARREPRHAISPDPLPPSAEGGSAIEITSGPEPRDERFQGVARRAEAMTTPDADPPRDADSLESLFGGAEVSGDDASAAGTLAAAFSADPPREVAGSPSARHGNSGEELSLQHLFGEVDERSSGAATLDEFFSGSRNGEQMASDGSAPAGAERADIEQFTAWLEGLKKK